MNLTLSIDDQTLTRARMLAQRRGTSLNQMVRDYLETLTASDPAQAVAELKRLWREEEGDSGGGWTGNREDAYDRPVLR
jgi:CRISPR/Cas system-associated protein Csm6